MKNSSEQPDVNHCELISQLKPSVLAYITSPYWGRKGWSTFREGRGQFRIVPRTKTPCGFIITPPLIHKMNERRKSGQRAKGLWKTALEKYCIFSLFCAARAELARWYLWCTVCLISQGLLLKLAQQMCRKINSLTICKFTLSLLLSKGVVITYADRSCVHTVFTLPS